MTQLPDPRRYATSSSTGAVYDHGAHVIDWTPAGGRPVLWMSAASDFDTTKPIRGGVPICWPWFGAGRSGDKAPAHGLARVTQWHVVREDVSEDSATVAFRLSDADLSDPQFTAKFEATYTVTFGPELTLALAVRNTGDETFTFEEALHTYLAVGDARQVTISGLDGAHYLEKAPGGRPDNTQSGDITFTAETDRVYSSTADVTLTDPVLGRTLTVRKEASANTVVWNPWVDKSRAMADFGDDEWVGMCCIEAANAGADAIELEPGDVHVLSYVLEVRQHVIA